MYKIKVYVGEALAQEITAKSHPEMWKVGREWAAFVAAHCPVWRVEMIDLRIKPE